MENPTKPNDELDQREAEATDKETLDDLQEAFGDEENTPEDQGVPSPDGTEDGEELLS
ncbi:MAG TPA: hypothetical protein VI306_18210 [Pyrinomonadaceae bacterium]